MLCLRVVLPAACVLAILLWRPPTAAASSEVTEQARKFLDAHTKKLRPLEVEASIAWWDANTSGKDEDFARKEKTQNKIDEALADRDAFAEVKRLKEQSKEIDDAVLRRAVAVLYLTYLEKQVDKKLLKKMVAKANAVEQAFNKFRAAVDGQEMTDSEVRKVLKESKDSARRQAVWEASKKVGQVVEADLKELVKLRNEAARALGYKNYHALELYLNEQDGEQLVKLFDELDELTREPFRAAKQDMDAKLASNAGVKAEDLMPWHYHDPFFQEAPAVFKADVDEPFQKADLVALCRDFYKGIDLPIDRVIEKSDLKERNGKSPHAFCTDIDRDGDVRVLANVVQNNYWMSTLLHEFGHSVYSTNNNDIPKTLPYVLRLESHILTTEGVA